MRVPLLLAALLLGSGCLAIPEPFDFERCRAVPDVRYFPTSGFSIPIDQWDPRQPYDLLAWRDMNGSGEAVEQEVRVPAGWNAEWIPLDNASRLRTLRLTPLDDAVDPIALRLDARVAEPPDGCPPAEPAPFFLPVASGSEGVVAEPGMGVWVYTAGFFPNGTIFYSNVAEMDFETWPLAHGAQAPTETTPLRVYVYDENPRERPEYWNLTTPSDARRVFDPGTQYVPTIAGFNEALKGLSTSTSRIVLVPPEKAYTRPGREDHWLYGETLIFWIKIARVVELPCNPAVDFLTQQPSVPDMCRPSSLS